MKHSENLLRHRLNGNRLNGFTDREIGDDHLYSGLVTPLRNDTFDTREIKKERICQNF
jgi:GTP cyclohydrolase I